MTQLYLRENPHIAQQKCSEPIPTQRRVIGMAELFAQHHLLTLFLVVGLGAMIGAIRLGPVRLGAAGVLFVGLGVSALLPGVGQDLEIVQQIGLAFFVYAVGISAGSHFFHSVRQQAGFLAWSALICLLGAIGAIIGGKILGLSPSLSVGLYTGALTAAPALDAASRLTSSPEAAVGYALAYPVGVLVGLIVVTVVGARSWEGKNDTPSLVGTHLEAATIRVEHPMSMRHIDGWIDQKVRLSYLRRNGKTRVVVPGEELLVDDEVIIVGNGQALDRAVDCLGYRLDKRLEDDRSDVAFERILLSNPALSGRTIAQLNMPARFGAVITRVRRGDLDLLAKDDLALQIGDHLAVVVPINELDDVQKWLGDSEKRVAEVDAMAIGLGMVVGMALGALSIPLPGGGFFQLGSAAGPLLVGLFLGALQRTGPLVWTLPASASMTIRQIGIMLFLAALGLVAGPDLAHVLSSSIGLYAVALAFAIVTICLLLQTFIGRMLGLSAARTVGAVAGFLGQPAVLQAAEARLADERVELAYVTLFAFTIIVKIFLVPLFVSF